MGGWPEDWPHAARAAADRAEGLPGAGHVIQWMGAHVWKVGGKVFAIVPEGGGSMTVKLPEAETARMLIEIGAARRAPHLPRGGWAAFDFPATPAEDAAARVADSHATVVASLPKRLRPGSGG